MLPLEKIPSASYMEDFQDAFSCISDGDIFGVDPLAKPGSQNTAMAMDAMFDFQDAMDGKQMNTDVKGSFGLEAPTQGGFGGPMGMDMVPLSPYPTKPRQQQITPPHTDPFSSTSMQTTDDASSVMSTESSAATSSGIGFVAGLMNYWRMDPTGAQNHQQSQPKLDTKDLKRRQDRNLREQKRSLKITQQIVHLKGVLEEDGRRMKNSKISILVEVEDYIKELEGAISQMSITKQQQQQAGMAWDGQSEGAAQRPPEASVNGVNYRSLFESSSAPMAVAGIDGRFLQSNPRVSAFNNILEREWSRIPPL